MTTVITSDMTTTTPVGRMVRNLAWALMLSVLAACATPQTDRLLSDPAGLPPRADVAEVPFYPQEDYYCGPAALAMTLAWSGAPVSTEDLVPQVYTPGREGTLHPDIVTTARRHGRLAVPVASLDALLAELAAGHPVLVFQNLGLGWYPQWHYAVAVAYDLDRELITLRSGMERRHTIALSTFEHTWARGERWALVVLPPDTLPARADAMTVIDAAAGIERAGQAAAAATAYETTLRQWPYLLSGWIGLGNARHARGDNAGAEEAFRQATEVAPDSPVAWNNLAHMLAERGRLPAARKAARRAISLAGDHPDDVYYQTLTEIEGNIAD